MTTPPRDPREKERAHHNELLQRWARPALAADVVQRLKRRRLRAILRELGVTLDPEPEMEVAYAVDP